MSVFDRIEMVMGGILSPILNGLQSSNKTVEKGMRAGLRVVLQTVVVGAVAALAAMFFVPEVVCMAIAGGFALLGSVQAVMAVRKSIPQDKKEKTTFLRAATVTAVCAIAVFGFGAQRTFNEAASQPAPKTQTLTSVPAPGNGAP